MGGRARPDELAARIDPCPRCNAESGERCTSRSGGTSSYVHPERYELAVAAGRVTLTPAPTGQR
jgi:hypothetical protein